MSQSKHATIHDLPRVDRPREKLMRYGPERLSNSELLAIILRTGKKGENVVEMSKKILQHFGSDRLPYITHDVLSEHSGLGPAKACEIVACFELGKRLLKAKQAVLLLSPKAVWDALKDIRDNKKEHTVVFYLDARSQEVKRDLVSIGTLTNSLVHPRELFEPAILHHAAHIIVAHNHPSCDPEPSDSDCFVTKRLVAAGNVLGIEVKDHVIVTKDRWVSMGERGLLIT